jgi:hypothetical protein
MSQKPTLVGVLAFASAAAALAGSCASQSASPLPNGTYTYVLCDRGCRKDSPTSTFVVSRSKGIVTIEEHDSPMLPDEMTRRILDSATFVTKSFTAYSGGRPEYAVTISESTATLRASPKR